MKYPNNKKPTKLRSYNCIYFKSKHQVKVNLKIFIQYIVQTENKDPVILSGS
jgi:hypothetical protein